MGFLCYDCTWNLIVFKGDVMDERKRTTRRF